MGHNGSKTRHDAIQGKYTTWFYYHRSYASHGNCLCPRYCCLSNFSLTATVLSHAEWDSSNAAESKRWHIFDEQRTAFVRLQSPQGDHQLCQFCDELSRPE